MPASKHGGFYLGSIGGPAAVLAQQSIKSLECVAYPELGMRSYLENRSGRFSGVYPRR
ncbi:fumarate hydratase C-terminal domain-containing protein [Klebsiella pneumoniae subsp. pneumoniae]|nr:fumarate hydratase C-terminal domain-containing protein [Klebsiella pneumoniae subsp. pneumoniae]